MCENGNIRWNQIHRQTMILITCKYNILAVLWYVWILSVCMRSQWEQANKHCLRTKIALYISQRCINCRIWSYCLAMLLCVLFCFYYFNLCSSCCYRFASRHVVFFEIHWLYWFRFWCWIGVCTYIKYLLTIQESYTFATANDMAHMPWLYSIHMEKGKINLKVLEFVLFLCCIYTYILFMCSSMVTNWKKN